MCMILSFLNTCFLQVMTSLKQAMARLVQEPELLSTEGFSQVDVPRRGTEQKGERKGQLNGACGAARLCWTAPEALLGCSVFHLSQI